MKSFCYTMMLFPARTTRSFAASLLLPALILASAGMISGCRSEDRVRNSQALASEIRSSKIKRITSAELATALHDAGQKIAVLATKSLDKNTAYPAGCIPVDSIKELDAVRHKMGVKIELLFAEDSASTDLFPKETDLLKAYHYQAVRGLALSDNLQKINDSLTIYYAPLKPGSAALKNCEKAASSPFALWRIVLNQKEIIKNLGL